MVLKFTNRNSTQHSGGGVHHIVLVAERSDIIDADGQGDEVKKNTTIGKFTNYHEM